MGKRQFSIYDAMEKVLLQRGDWIVERNVKNITRCDLILGDRFDIPYSTLRTSIYANARATVPLINYFKGSHRLTLKASMAKFLRDVPDIDVIMPKTFIIGHGSSQVQGRSSLAHVRPNSLMTRATKSSLLAVRREKLKQAAPSEPSELDQLADEMLRHPERIFIAKPSAGCKGAGIVITKDIQTIRDLAHKQTASGELAEEEGPVEASAALIYAVQEYIVNPFLLDGRKFDIRVWALVAPPFDIYVFDQGSCRTASAKYSLDDLSHSLAHLTNHGLQEQSEDFGKFEHGNELWYSDLDKHLKQKFGSRCSFDADVRPKINDVVRKCLFAAKELLQVASNERFQCFQLFGFDLMLTDDLEVKMVEINGSPGSADRWLPSIVEGMVDVVIDPRFPPITEASQRKKAEVLSSLSDVKMFPDGQIGKWVKVWGVDDPPPFEKTKVQDLDDALCEVVLPKARSRHVDPLEAQ